MRVGMAGQERLVLLGVKAAVLLLDATASGVVVSEEMGTTEVLTEESDAEELK